MAGTGVFAGMLTGIATATGCAELAAAFVTVLSVAAAAAAALLSSSLLPLEDGFVGPVCAAAWT